MLFFKKEQTQTKFYVPLGVSHYLIGWGIESMRITELDWWDESDIDGIQVACTPSQHFSGRTGPRGLRTLWASWVLQTSDMSIYFSGDSGYDIHFKQIGDKYGPFDIAFHGNRSVQSDVAFIAHVPEESAQGGVDLQAKAVHPIHWGNIRWPIMHGMIQSNGLLLKPPSYLFLCRFRSTDRW